MLDTLLTRYGNQLIVAGVVLCVMMLFSPGRSLLGFLMNQLWRLGEWLFGVVINAAQAWLVKILKAHMMVFRNMMPRMSVLPTVAKKTTRKE